MELLWQVVREGLAPLLPRLSGLVTAYLSVLIGALPFMVVAAFVSAILEGRLHGWWSPATWRTPIRTGS